MTWRQQRKLVSAAVRCPFDIDIVFKGKIFIDAKSILGVLVLAWKNLWNLNMMAMMKILNQ